MKKKESPKSESGAKTPKKTSNGKKDFLCVGLGASAGGIKALQEFFATMPPNSGMAFVVILHLNPHHESNLAEILAARTAMPVIQVTETHKVEPNHVYVIPPSHNLEMVDGVVRCTTRMDAGGERAAIDVFFRTLGDAYQNNGVCVVLSGTGADGTNGLKRIKERNGFAVVQEPSDAEYDQMPRSAIATGLADWILPVGQMPEKLIGFKASSERLHLTEDDPEKISKEIQAEESLREILTILRVRTGHDFSNYKTPTLIRRIARHLQIHELEDIPSYLAFLRDRPDEIQFLQKNLLINVTNFFRDEEAFDALEKQVIPNLFAGKTMRDTVRVWSAGCASGEEAYSLAMLLAEYAGRMKEPPKFQVFATDVDDAAIEEARAASFAETIEADVSPERLKRFFLREGSRYRIRKSLRETILFAPHNVLRDPPFSRLDLIVCRNMLIYLNRAAQERVMEIFHFALATHGYLFLGSSETADGAPELFKPVDKKSRIYHRRPTAFGRFQQPPKMLQVGRQESNALALGKRRAAREEDEFSYGAVHRKILERFAAPSVLVNKDFETVYMSESVGRFLRFAGGEPSRNLLKMVHPDLLTDLRAALFSAQRSGQAAEHPNVRLRADGEETLVNLIVRAVNLEEDEREFLLVFFDEHKKETGSSAEDKAAANLNREKAVRAATKDEQMEGIVLRLEEDLRRTKENLRSMTEQHEVTVEELKSSNEELQAINEELRSVLEEFETGKEELQSVNEELITVNHELKEKMDETARVNSDLQNLMFSTDIATIFLDRDLRIKRYTPPVEEIFNVLKTDTGRPLAHITHRLDYENLASDAETVLRKLAPLEREINNRDGRVFLLRVLPYRTLDDRIDGAVLNFIDITERKRADAARFYLASIVESSEDSMLTVDLSGTITSWNRAAEQLYGYPASEAVGKPLTMLALPADLAEVVRDADKIRDSRQVEIHDTVRVNKDGREMNLEVVLSPVKDSSENIIGVSIIARDVTMRRRAEATVKLDLQDTKILQELSTRLVSEENVETIYDEVMTAAIRLTRADAGTVQILDADTQELVLLSTNGFEGEIIEYSRRVNAGSNSSCGIALKKGERTFVDFDPNDREKASRLHVEAGYLSAQSTPLIARSGAPIGMLNTHWKKANHRPSERELRFLDLLARQASDLIEQRQTEERLRRAAETDAFRVELGDALRFESDPVAIQAAVTELVMNRFGADRCYYCEVEGDDRVIIRRDAARGDLPSVAGVYSLNEFPLLTRTINGGVPLVVADSNQTDLMDAELKRLCVQMKVISFVNVPVMKENRLVGCLCITRSAPRNWADSETHLAEEIAERTWSAIERARAEAARQASEEQLRQLIKNLPGGGVFVLDRDSRYLVAAGEAVRAAGLAPEDFIGKTIHEALPPDIAAEYEPLFKRALAGADFAHEHAAHGRILVSRGTPLRDANGEVYAVLVISYDISERKAAETLLQESETRFRAMFEQANVGIVQASLDGKIQIANPGFCKIVGYREDECESLTVRDITHPDDYEADMEQARRVIEGEMPGYTIEKRYVRKTGETVWVQMTSTLVRDAAGAPFYALAVVEDINERKVAEIALREVEERFNQAARVSGFGVHDLDVANRRIYWSPELKAMHGVAPDAPLEFENFDRYIHPDDRGRVNRAVRDALDPQGAGEFEEEFRIIRQDNGEMRWLYDKSHTVFAGEGGNRRAVRNTGVILDITDRKRSDEALRQSEERLRLATNAGLFGVWDWDYRREIMRWTPRLFEMLGLSPTEDLRATLKDFARRVHPDDYDKLIAESQRAQREHEDFRYEYRILRADTNEIRWLSVNEQFFYDAAGEAVRCVGVARDVTKRKRAQERMRESEERLRLIMESVKDYAIITTDLKGVITDWNAGAEKTFGWTRDEMIGKTADLIFTAEDRRANVAQQEMQTALTNGFAEDERFHVRKDGSRFYASGVMTLLKDGKVEGFVKIARDQTERMRAERDVQEKEMLRRLVAGQEEERRRIARDIHDHFGQQLTALRLKLDAVKKICGEQTVCDAIDQAQKVAANLDADADFIAWELRPAALDDLGLRLTLSNFAREWAHHTGIQTEFHSTGLQKIQLGNELETNLYRIAQEALNNIYKHAKAKNVSILLEKRADKIVLIVEDDGKGFDPDDKTNRRQGIGLIGMEERARILGGELEIESSVNGGTTVYARIPLKTESQ